VRVIKIFLQFFVEFHHYEHDENFAVFAHKNGPDSKCPNSYLDVRKSHLMTSGIQIFLGEAPQTPAVARLMSAPAEKAQNKLV
jgi:hypothetical protein